MAILKIRDANGNIQEILAIKGKDGKDYVLTDADKQEIAGMISGGGGGGTVDLSNVTLFKKVSEEELNALEYSEEIKKTMVLVEDETAEGDVPFYQGMVFSFGNNLNGIMSQVAITEDGSVLVRNVGETEWKTPYCKAADFNNFKLGDKEAEATQDETLQSHEDRLQAIENGNYVEKVEYTSDNGTYKGAVYIVDYSNTDTYKQLSSQAMTDTIPLRNHNRNFYVGDVKLDYECTNKKYVDDAIKALRAEFTSGDEVSY